MHQVRASSFVSDRWIEALLPNDRLTAFFKVDFRVTGSAQFQALMSLCRLSNQVIEDSLSDFDATRILNPQVLSQKTLSTSIESSIRQFQSAMPVAFRSQLNLINRMVFGNQLFSRRTFMAFGQLSVSVLCT